MIFVPEDSNLWKSKKIGLHIKKIFFCPKDLQGGHGSLKGNHGTKIIVQHMVNLHISDLQGGHGTMTPP